jgi:hypothetical protein
MTMTSRTHRLAAAVLCAGALTALTACGGGAVNATAGAPAGNAPAGASAAAPTSVEAEDTSVFEVEVGQCVDAETADGEEVSSLPVVDCSQPHQGEIYALPQLPDGDFPGDAAVTQAAEEECLGQAFTDYVGLSYQESEFQVAPYLPNAESWAGGDREIVCVIASTEPGSVRGSNR